MTVKVAAASLAVLAGLAGAAAPPEAGIQMGQPVEYPHAGIALAVPQGYDFQITNNAGDVMRALKVEKQEPVHSISLSAFPIQAEHTAETVFETIISDIRSNLAFRDVKELASKTMPIAGVQGPLRLLSYVFRGRDYVAVQVCFVRRLTSPELSMAYLLNVEMVLGHKAQLIRTVDAVAETVKFIELRQGATLPVQRLGEPIPDVRHGYSIRPPHGWFVSPSREGMMLAQADYVLGGAVPQLKVIVEEVPALTSGREYAEVALGGALKDAERHGVRLEKVSEGPIGLAGRDGYQLILTQGAGRDPSDPFQAPLTRVFRVTCRPLDDQRAKSFGLHLIYYGQDVKAAEAMMDKIAEGFKLLQPPSQTQSAPASAPALEK